MNGEAGSRNDCTAIIDVWQASPFEGWKIELNPGFVFVRRVTAGLWKKRLERFSRQGSDRSQNTSQISRNLFGGASIHSAVWSLCFLPVSTFDNLQSSPDDRARHKRSV